MGYNLQIMDIAARNLIHPDFYILIKSERECTDEEAHTIVGMMEAWLKVAQSGAFREPVYSFTTPKHYKKSMCVAFMVNLGFMDLESGLDILEKICDGLNGNVFKEELITEIELNGLWESGEDFS